jgi:broad specificity phosphatase PhoE
VAEEMPEEYLARKNNKLHYRYPRGESYQDVIHRLEPVITELMRSDQPTLIVAHQAILRVLYAYLTNKSPYECPTLNIPLHVVIQVTPKAYKCEEVWHRPM